jgi:hypothetical protein
MSCEGDRTQPRQVPIPSDESVRASDNGASKLERLVADGRLRPARRDLRSLGLPSEAPHEISISRALDELRSGT